MVKDNGENIDFSTNTDLIVDMGNLPVDPWCVVGHWIPQEEGHEHRSCIGTLSTTDKYGMLSARMMNARIDSKGVYFATHKGSRKWGNCVQKSKASWHVYWPKLRRQLDVRGELVEAPVSFAERWWNERPVNMDLISSLSKQSHEISLEEFEKLRTKAVEDSLHLNSKLPRPENFIVLRLEPVEIELWEGMFDRVHYRFLYTKIGTEKWGVKRLYP